MDCKKNEVLELKMAIQPHLCCSVYCNGYDAPNGDDIGDFACNICLDLAHDPIVTLCGHLFCWPCLYEWLQYYSRCYECPVCKAVVDEEKLVPLYGRGKKSTDPRMKVVPRRPVGCRPETAVYGNAGGHQLTGGTEFEI